MRLLILVLAMSCLSKTYAAQATASSTITVTISPSTSINLKTANLQMTALSAGGTQGGEVSSSFDTFATFGSSIVISATANNLTGYNGTTWGEGDTLTIEAVGYQQQFLIENGQSLSLVPIALITTITNQTTPYTIKYYNKNSSRSTGNLSCTITITASSP